MNDLIVAQATTGSAQRAGRPWAYLMVMIVLLAGCAGTPKPDAQPVDQHTPCQAAAPADAWVGNWLAVSKRQGVAGELHVLMTLRQDGAMAYVEQLKRSGKSPQTLSETGCWHRTDETLVLRTTHSNAVVVELGDPIYTNEYAVRTGAGRLALDGPQGPLGFKKMPDDYRLPVF